MASYDLWHEVKDSFNLKVSDPGKTEQKNLLVSQDQTELPFRQHL
jgi:hypothetical protein